MSTVTLAMYHYRTQEPAGGSIVVCGSTMGIQRCRAVDYGECSVKRNPHNTTLKPSFSFSFPPFRG